MALTKVWVFAPALTFDLHAAASLLAMLKSSASLHAGEGRAIWDTESLTGHKERISVHPPTWLQVTTKDADGAIQ